MKGVSNIGCMQSLGKRTKSAVNRGYHSNSFMPWSGDPSLLPTCVLLFAVTAEKLGIG